MKEYWINVYMSREGYHMYGLKSRASDISMKRAIDNNALYRIHVILKSDVEHKQNFMVKIN